MTFRVRSRATIVRLILRNPLIYRRFEQYFLTKPREEFNALVAFDSYMAHRTRTMWLLSILDNLASEGHLQSFLYVAFQERELLANVRKAVRRYYESTDLGNESESKTRPSLGVTTPQPVLKDPPSPEKLA